ncbi:lys-63-specific deubiquitinase BRCC36-like [Arctopsyche grandis]|uniref:lys-63-specific deubiquitinase BRCC36-like n=1 Tax=Arctopsyche grandis TaxID=121162 RepID=UPI00406D6513
MQSLQLVQLSADVFTVCLQHALATEREEIMGLLIGEVDDESTVVSIAASLILRRSDKKPDRVEISEEQLVSATIFAEDLAYKTGKPLRVVGWYHSHPHITVWPSHVDLDTQAMYQQMDSSFVGLIFAVFLTEQSTKAHEVQVTCFQSVETSSSRSRIEIPLVIVQPQNALLSTCFETLIQLPKIFDEEENETFSKETGGIEGDFLTEQHNEAVRTIALGHIAEKMTRPMMEVLAERNQYSKTRLQMLRNYHKFLMGKLEECGLLL